MTKLILEYDFPHKNIDLTPNQTNLFPNPIPNNLSPYLNRNNDGDLVVTKKFFNGKAVDDVHRYDLKYCNGEWMLFEPRSNNLATLKPLSEKPSKHDRDITPNKAANNILIILESPHKDEYDDDNFLPLGPANGATGENFLNYFASPCMNIVLYKLIKDLHLNLDEGKVYSICFVNPVPFQTTLDFILRPIKSKKKDKKAEKTYRDQLKTEVWNALFYYCHHHFKCRVLSYNPSVIINACTKELKDKVKLAVDNPNNQIKCPNKFNTTHPSGWHGSNLSKTICTIW
ncbi:MAG: hypothetical protein WAW36_04955 [Methylovulum miyakonense]|uniref:hypothetical protein n=1 Tax=Methylovulum miyakonense TaxID=645578 RepID=UPI003BB6C5EA